jgi:hypothetical protein
MKLDFAPPDLHDGKTLERSNDAAPEWRNWQTRQLEGLVS